MLLSFERLIVGAFAFLIPKGHAAAPHWSGASSPAGVEEHVQTDNRGSPGTWEILSFPRQIPGWSHQVTDSGLGGGLDRQGANATSATEVLPSEGNERGGMGGRKS